MKLLILSDVHYPEPYSMLYKKIIEAERPDNIIFLGDNVEAKGKSNGMNLHERFIWELKNIIELDKIVYLLGDNDYNRNFKKLRKFNFMNSDFLFFSIGNMRFFHGNIESFLPFSGAGHFAEKLGRHLVSNSFGAGKALLPKAVSLASRIAYKVPNDAYLFEGHIHLLKKTGKHDIFCGTLRNKRLVYNPEESLGYVTVEHRNFFVSKQSDIRIKRIDLPKITYSKAQKS